MLHPAVSTSRFILSHPLGSRRPLRALATWARWQISQRIFPGDRVVPFVDGTRLLVRRGMTGATGNVYVGLHELEPMSFVLHLLRKGDLFVDVGANVGSYTVLAAGVRGARGIAIEPITPTMERLRDNVRLNYLDELVEMHSVALGAARGTARFIADQDTTNRFTSDGSYRGTTVDVPVETLDHVVGRRAPTFVKIDVEGFEGSVLAGAQRVFAADSGLLAALVEIGVDAPCAELGATVAEWLAVRGFQPIEYDPFTRTIRSRDVAAGNVLFVRDVEVARARTSSADAFSVLGESL